MPKLTVIGSAAARDVPFSSGVSVREILEGAGFLVRSGCRGDGACGLCLVQIEAGDVNSPTKNERLMLTPDQLARNFRLACQLMPEDDIHLRIINEVSKLNWRNLAPDCLPCSPSHVHPLVTRAPADIVYGLAIDVGTTQISVSLWDLKQGRRLHSRIAGIGLAARSGGGARVPAHLSVGVGRHALQDRSWRDRPPWRRRRDRSSRAV